MAFLGFDTPRKLRESISDTGKYAGDFQNVEETDAKGRVRKKALYTGIWFVCRDPREAGRKLFVALGASVALVLVYLRLLTAPHQAAGQLWVMLPLLAGLYPAGYLIMGLTALPYRGKPQRRDQYMHSFIRASRSAAAVTVFVTAGAVISLILRTIEGDWFFLKQDWLFLAGCLVSAGLGTAVILLLRSVDIAEKENSAYESKPL